MSDSWDDFANSEAKGPRKRQADEDSKEKADDQKEAASCNWGQLEADDRPSAAAKYGRASEQQEDSECPNFISLYEQYLADKKSIPKQTRNFKSYSRNPQQYLRDWFESEAHEDEFKLETQQQQQQGEFVCSLDLPVGEHDFTLHSEPRTKRSEAANEVCLDACRLLDACQLLHAPTLTSSRDGRNEDAAAGDDEDGAENNAKEDLARKRRIAEASREDDIEFDSTMGSSKRQRSEVDDGVEANNKPSARQGNQVNTYQSLMAQWSAVNMSILQLKAKLVKLDLSVAKTKKETPSGVSRGMARDDASDCAPGDDEIDPLDEFMSNLETKKAPSMDDKIEKSRLKLQIATQEREQTKLARMIELAKPAATTSKQRPL